MRSYVTKCLFLAGIALVIGARSAAAEEVVVKIPFPFVVHNQTLPAGLYVIEPAELDGSVLLIRGEHGTKGSAYITTETASGHDPAGEKPALSFEKDENQYRLVDVWGAAPEGRTVTR